MLSVLQQYPLGYAIGLFVVGACVGSFLNVVILRLPRLMQHQWNKQCRQLLELAQDDSDSARQQPPGLVVPPSHCPGCKALIRPWHNIPLLSYLLLRGRCANCKQSISLRYPLVELITALLTLLAGFHFAPGFALLAALLFTWSLVALSFIDLDHQILPDNITLPLLWLGLLANTLGLFTTLEEAVLGAIGGYLSLWLVYQIHHRLTGREGMGYGDFKLLAVIGAWLGWKILPVVVLMASLAGSVIALSLILVGRHRREIPISFGPYLAIASWMAMMWGDSILHNYLRIFAL